VRTVVALGLLAVLLAGCGASAPRDSAKKFKGDQQKVAAVIESLETAARDNKPNDVCGKLFTAGRLKLLEQQGTNCKTGVKEAFSDADTLDLTVKSVAITGTSAVATIVSGTGSKQETDKLDLLRSGTTWQIDSLGS
jgi:hypothetical protein